MLIMQGFGAYQANAHDAEFFWGAVRQKAVQLMLMMLGCLESWVQDCPADAHDVGLFCGLLGKMLSS